MPAPQSSIWPFFLLAFALMLLFGGLTELLLTVTSGGAQ